ncbi:zinc finger CCCH domain-containing protein 13-like [Penaeus monodon]|uniref:zinc finger CCCH domain-containing protein 13-like n=1 Tax=Penaeus monodon TaxID=6687 RepID=UPI0018A7B325|nr:zinc finger CCCH domain-containing protein 13-like [Penaeus monodon]
MPVPLGPSSHHPPSPHTTTLPPGPLTPPPEDGWTWPLPENTHRNVHGNNIHGISSSNNRGNVYGDTHSSTHRMANERPGHIHNTHNLSSNGTHNSHSDILFDETDPTVQAGYRHCLREAVRFLVHVEHLSWDDPIVRGLLEHLALPRAHDELQRIVETLNTDKEEAEKEEGEEELDEKEEEEEEEKDEEESECYSSSSSLPVSSLSSASDLPSSLRNVGYEITLTEDSDEEDIEREEEEAEDKEEGGRMLDMEEIERELTEMQRREEAKAEEKRQRDERERREKRQREEEEEERERREKRRREEQDVQKSGENQRQIHMERVEAETESQSGTEEERDIQIEIENQRESDKEREKQRAGPIAIRNEEMRKQLLRYVYQGCDLIVTPAPLPSPSVFLARHHM